MRATLLAVAVASLAACATRVPLTKLTDARGEIRAAEQLDADRISTASSYLDLARQEEEQGRQLLNLRQSRRAGYVLERAQADAELALALAAETPARDQARRALDRVRQLQSQTPSATEVNP